MGAATGREAVVAERAVGVEGMEEATAAAAQQALAGPAVKAMGSLVDRQRQIQTRLMRARPRINPGGAVRRKNVEKRMKTDSEGCESRLVELRDTKARAVS